MEQHRVSVKGRELSSACFPDILRCMVLMSKNLSYPCHRKIWLKDQKRKRANSAHIWQATTTWHMNKGDVMSLTHNIKDFQFVWKPLRTLGDNVREQLKKCATGLVVLRHFECVRGRRQKLERILLSDCHWKQRVCRMKPWPVCIFYEFSGDNNDLKQQWKWNQRTLQEIECRLFSRTPACWQNKRK